MKSNILSKLIFASCVVGTCNVLYYVCGWSAFSFFIEHVGEFLLGGVLFFVHYSLMVSVTPVAGGWYISNNMP